MQECPVCHTTIPPQADADEASGAERVECPSCDAHLERRPGHGWTLRGDAPAG